MTFQAEDEIAAIDLGHRRRLRRRPRHHHDLGPGHGPEDRGHRPRHRGRAAARDRATSSAAGPRPACPPRPSRPTCLQALFGRNSEAPMPVLAAATPGDCFWVALEASRIAIKYMVPVIVLSDGYLANGAEPWRIPDVDDLPEIPVKFRTDPEGFLPYSRDPETLARPWAVPARRASSTASAASRSRTSPATSTTSRSNHEQMVRLRAAKVEAHRPGRARRRARGRPRGRPAGRRLGLDLRRDHRRAARRARARAARSATSTCAT